LQISELRVQARTNALKARFAQPIRHNELTRVIRFGGSEQSDELAIENVATSLFPGFREGPVEHRNRRAKKEQQQHTDRDQESAAK
jgi:hypothetical protein